MDIRVLVKQCHKSIGSVVSTASGDLQICYYSDKKNVKNSVLRCLSAKSLLQCFVNVVFIECPPKE